MTEWSDQFAKIRAQFLIRAKDRLAEIDQSITAYEAALDLITLSEVRRHFHWLAGVGGTYQLPEVSALGTNGEEICDAVLDKTKEPSADDVQRLRDILVAVNSLFAGVG